jgi:5-methyltetrahydrofolate--homocysteine methyltransferase
VPDWQQILAEKQLLISDGAWGTELAKAGMEPGAAPELWNRDRPDDIRAVAAAYVEAGSDIILSNTFGGTRFKLEKAGLAGDLAELNRLGAVLSKEAAAGRGVVFASVGPTGEFMQPLGLVSEEAMVAAFAEQVSALVAGGADGIVIETMTDLGEAKAALRAVRDNSDLPAVVSMTFDKGEKGFATMMGVRPERAAEELTEAGASAVGANCGSGIDDVTVVARLMSAATDLPIWAKPNAGLPQLVGGQTVYRETPERRPDRLPGDARADGRAPAGPGRSRRTHRGRMLRHHARPHPRARRRAAGPGSVTMDRDALRERLAGGIFLSSMMGWTDGAYVAEHGRGADMVQIGALVADAADRGHEEQYLLPVEEDDMVPVLAAEVDAARAALGDTPIALNAACGDLESALRMATAFDRAGGDVFELNCHGGYGRLMERGLLRAMAFPENRPEMLRWLRALCELDIPVAVKLNGAAGDTDLADVLREAADVRGVFAVHLNVRGADGRPNTALLRSLAPLVPGMVWASGHAKEAAEVTALLDAGADCVGLAQGAIDEPGIIARLASERRGGSEG